MFTQVTVILSIVAVLIMVQLFRMTCGFRHYTVRQSQQQHWQALFPVTEHQQLIEQMLEGFGRSFLFPRATYWCFRPEDKIATVLGHTDNNHTDHLQYDMFFVVLQDLGLKERPRFEEVDLRTVAELLIAARFNN
jgi:hypothetical protein